mmetsp:Transcript_20079/g.14795  ORF Transcript_20079/g.14795 Transcript_20079/m.14795 type:complete len:190 (-) Transcript_20079:2627-3196(-)
MLFKSVTNKEVYEAEAKKKLDEEKEIKTLRYQMQSNPKLLLLEALVRVNAFDLVEAVLGGLYGLKFDLTLHKGLLRALLDCLSWCVDHIYRSSLPQGLPMPTPTPSPFITYKELLPHPSDLSQCSTFEDLPKQLPKLLRVLSIYVGLDSVTFIKVCRVLKVATSTLREFSLHVGGTILFPALALADCNN